MLVVFVAMSVSIHEMILAFLEKLELLPVKNVKHSLIATTIDPCTPD